MIPKGIGQVSAEDSPCSHETSDGRVSLTIDESVYSRESILNTAYKFTESCFVFLSRSDNDPRTTFVTLARKRASDTLEGLAGEFSNELIDQQLRVHLEDRYGPIRTLIVAQAFAEGNLLDEQRESGSYDEDPKGAGGRR